MVDYSLNDLFSSTENCEIKDRTSNERVEGETGRISDSFFVSAALLKNTLVKKD